MDLKKPSSPVFFNKLVRANNEWFEEACRRLETRKRTLNLLIVFNNNVVDNFFKKTSIDNIKKYVSLSYNNSRIWNFDLSPKYDFLNDIFFILDFVKNINDPFFKQFHSNIQKYIKNYFSRTQFNDPYYIHTPYSTMHILDILEDPGFFFSNVLFTNFNYKIKIHKKGNDIVIFFMHHLYGLFARNNNNYIGNLGKANNELNKLLTIFFQDNLNNNDNWICVWSLLEEYIKKNPQFYSIFRSFGRAKSFNSFSFLEQESYRMYIDIIKDMNIINIENPGSKTLKILKQSKERFEDVGRNSIIHDYFFKHKLQFKIIYIYIKVLFDIFPNVPGLIIKNILRYLPIYLFFDFKKIEETIIEKIIFNESKKRIVNQNFNNEFIVEERPIKRSKVSN